MKRLFVAIVCFALAGAVLLAQLRGGRQRKDEDEPAKLPNGQLQSEQILKADFEKSLQDAAELVKLSEDLKAELEKNERHVLSMSSIKKTEEIEKIAKRLRSRMKRF